MTVVIVQRVKAELCAADNGRWKIKGEISLQIHRLHNTDKCYLKCCTHF